MFNRKYLIAAAVSPLLIAVAIFIIGVFYEPVFGVAVIGLYYEHIWIALAVGTDLQKYSGGGFVPFAVVPWAGIAALLIDYLLLAGVTYAILLIKAKISARSSDSLP